MKNRLLLISIFTTLTIGNFVPSTRGQTTNAGLTNPIAQRIPKGSAIIDVEKIAAGLVSPLGLVEPDDGSGRLFVYDQIGVVYVLNTATNYGTNVILLDVRNRLVRLNPGYDERGLLGFAVHPQFAQNPRVYTFTSEPVATNGTNQADFTTSKPADQPFDHQNVLAEWQIATSGDPNNLLKRREILRIDQPQGNHNAGTLRFGPDGFLYLSLGDGGGAEDYDGQPFFGEPMFGHGTGNAQNLQRIYGKILRLDVRGTNSVNGQYGIPTDNPFQGTNGLGEIYAYGFRNPYAFSFDRLTGDLYLGDAGENYIEEFNRVAKGGNYGWNLKEGSFFFNQNGTNVGFVTLTPGPDWTNNVTTTNLLGPIAEYDHDEGRVAVGGFVYRGTNVAALFNTYVAGEFIYLENPTGRLLYYDFGRTNLSRTNGNGGTLNGTNTTPQTALQEARLGIEDRPLGLLIKGFGEDQAGELYVLGSTELGPTGTSGKVLKIVNPPKPIFITNFTLLSATNVAFAWTGGKPPFYLSHRASLSDGGWSIDHFTTDRVATVVAEGGYGFFRIGSASYLQVTPLTAVLSGSAERPQPVTNTLGGGAASLVLDGDFLSFAITYTNLTGAAAGAHIHGPASVDEATNVMVNLEPFNGGAFGTNGSLSGTVRLTPEQQTHLLSGHTYINIHTPLNPNGEIRGQIVPVLMKASLSGGNERPTPVATSGRGSGHFLLAGRELTFAVTYQNLTDPATAAHIHGPATPAESAGVLVPLNPFNGGAFGTNGSLSGTVTLTEEQYAHLIAGKTYVNIHTPTNPAGEIRGQILPVPLAYPFSASLSGRTNLSGSFTTNRGGLAIFSLAGDLLTFDIGYTNLVGEAAGAWIEGALDDGGTTLVSLQAFNGRAFGTNGLLSGQVELTPEQKVSLLNSMALLDIDTRTPPQGGVIGTIAPVLRRISLSGSSQRPTPVITTGTGSGILLQVANRLNFNISYSGLPTVASGVSLHGPAATFGTASALVDLAPHSGGALNTSGALSGNISLTPEQLSYLNAGHTYINFSTSTNTNGEIRGQITP